MLDRNLLGEWFSTFQTNEPSPQWSWEKISIRRKLRYKLVLETVACYNDESHEYKWKSTRARVFEGKYIHGEYRSIRDPNSRGVFMLLVRPAPGQVGTTPVGFFLGPGLAGNFNFGAWLLVKAKQSSKAADDKAYFEGTESVFIAAEAHFRNMAPTLYELFDHEKKMVRTEPLCARH